MKVHSLHCAIHGRGRYRVEGLYRSDAFIDNGQFSVQNAGIEPGDHTELARLLQIVVLCSETEVETQAGGYALHGSSTENALVHMALCASVDVVQLRQQYPQVHQHPRAEDRKACLP